MNTHVKFILKSGFYLTGNLITDKIETEESILQRMHKSVDQMAKELPVIGEEKPPTPIPPKLEKIHEFTLFSEEGIKIGHGDHFWVVCDQVRTVEVISSTKW